MVDKDAKVPSTEPPAESLKVPQFRIISPDQGWYLPDSRSPSPVSPRISPSPKAMKAATPDLRIRITRDLPDRTVPNSSHITQALISPRPVRWRRQLSSDGSSKSSKSNPADTLTVPSLRKDRETESSSSLSSCYPSSSRSASNSPMTPDAPLSPRWYPETPPSTPGLAPPSVTHSQSDVPSDSDLQTSSTQRPLGITVNSKESQSPVKKPSGKLPEWQKERWKHWEKIAKEHSDEFHEQETLV